MSKKIVATDRPEGGPGQVDRVPAPLGLHVAPRAEAVELPTDALPDPSALTRAGDRIDDEAAPHLSPRLIGLAWWWEPPASS